MEDLKKYDCFATFNETENRITNESIFLEEDENGKCFFMSFIDKVSFQKHLISLSYLRKIDYDKKFVFSTLKKIESNGFCNLCSLPDVIHTFQKGPYNKLYLKGIIVDNFKDYNEVAANQFGLSFTQNRFNYNIILQTEDRFLEIIVYDNRENYEHLNLIHCSVTDKISELHINKQATCYLPLKEQIVYPSKMTEYNCKSFKKYSREYFPDLEGVVLTNLIDSDIVIYDYKNDEVHEMLKRKVYIKESNFLRVTKDTFLDELLPTL